MLGLFPNTWMLLLMYGINTALTAILLVCLWFIYIKMGVPGWKGIVPFYNIWTAVKTLKKPFYWFWIILGATVALCWSGIFIAGAVVLAIQGIVPDVSETMVIGASILATLSFLAGLIFSILLAHALSRSFGHGAGFTVGQVLLPFVFYPILAFGESEFIVPEEKKARPEIAAEGERMAEEEIRAESSTGSVEKDEFFPVETPEMLSENEE